jgi:hypothetical protein
MKIRIIYRTMTSAGRGGHVACNMSVTWNSMVESWWHNGGETNEAVLTDTISGIAGVAKRFWERSLGM